MLAHLNLISNPTYGKVIAYDESNDSDYDGIEDRSSVYLIDGGLDVSVLENGEFYFDVHVHFKKYNYKPDVIYKGFTFIQRGIIDRNS